MNIPHNHKKLSYSMICDKKKLIYPKYRHLTYTSKPRPRAIWIEDSIVHKCQNCSNPFSLFTRKHHCRNCGRIFCYECCSHFIQLPKNTAKQITNESFLPSFSSLQRVCKECNSDIKQFKYIQKLFHIFNIIGLDINDIHILGQVQKSWREVSIYYKKHFREIQYQMVNNSKINYATLLINNRKIIKGHSKWMIQYLCNPYIDVILKEEFIKFKDSNCKCWKIMCTRDCNNQLLPEDAILCLEKCGNSHRIIKFLCNILNNCPIFEFNCYIGYIISVLCSCKNVLSRQHITKLLLERSQKSFVVTNAIFWETTYNISTKDNSNKGKYRMLRTSLLEKLNQNEKSQLKSTYNFVNQINKIIEKSNDTDKLKKKIEELTKEEKDIHYPLNPNELIVFTDIENIKEKKSASNPITIPVETFNSHNDSSTKHTILCKKDDVKIDQIILQCITLIDNILIRNGINLGITDYNVLPISNSFGLIEIVPNANTIYDIQFVKKFSIQNFIIENNSSVSIHDIRKDYMNSCVGYCIIGYILGIGDRHLENIMITKGGRIFHIDFEYILGQEPKLFSPEIRITPEMIDAMGGCNSLFYKEFKELCSKSFTCIRRHANLFYILLLQLTEIDSKKHTFSKEDIYNQVMTRFMVGEQHDTAELHFITKVIESSSSSYKHKFIDYTHDTSLSSRAIHSISSVKNSFLKYLDFSSSSK